MNDPDLDATGPAAPTAPTGPEQGSGGAGPLPEDPTPRPVTGDRAVDDALASFDRALGDGPAAQAEAAAEAHRALQARLTAPATQPAVPGEARPGPRR